MITIGFFSHNTWNARIIEWFEQSPISHSAIGFVKDGKSYWIHAVGGGVQIVDRGWLDIPYAEFQILPDIQNEVELSEKKVGEPYAYLTMLGFAIMVIAKWFGIAIDNPFYDSSSAFCSEFVVEVDIQHLISEFDGLDPADISPAILFDICSKGRSFRRII